eukprot:gnl/Ergobibamus_cyprinoides/813.p1 GENE.gnl/Ergobibamus_cyprinoides/813~~gnl/Ergobibamus_cyprinoides/813.p1  ORF type:complete len:388 (+),score=204.89 gnl/Ergobibamus_cyprinoides/813:162-1166(+)
MAYKAGMTHVVRDQDKPGSTLHKKEVLEATTILECPPMVVIGLVGYIETPRGLRALATVWAETIGEEAKRRFYKSWFSSKKKAFTKYAAKYAESKEEIDATIARITKYATVVRVIAHTQISKIPTPQKKAHIMEVQINGGSIAEKVAFGVSLFEQQVAVGDIFTETELIDTIAVNKGKGFEGVTTRWGTSRLPRKTRRGLRKVACIGAWHPCGVQYTVARAGQNGFHHRTEVMKQIFRIANGSEANSGSTVHDLTQKPITPMGGFPHYGEVKSDFIMIKGSCPGVKRRVVTLRKTLCPKTMGNSINLKFIDTSSKFGHGMFQSADEKAKFYGRA